MTRAEIESARREWEDGYRRLLEEARGGAADPLHAQVDVLRDELRRRVGGTFTLAELTREYANAERWSRQVVSEHVPSRDWTRSLSVVEAAAFHLYALGAIDYEP